MAGERNSSLSGHERYENVKKYYRNRQIILWNHKNFVTLRTFCGTSLKVT